MDSDPEPPRVTLARARANPAATWPKRSDANRLEPECWPAITPSFRIARGARVFTMGSCFARNIEWHLACLGFDVPAITRTLGADGQADPSAGGRELLNKYTPTSIRQELAWARAILDRDGVVGPDDVTPLLLDLGGDRFVDLHSRADPGYGLPFAEQLARRRTMYDVTRTAFDCDVAVITLGLIETWWDTRTGQSIEFHPRMMRHPDAGYLAFRPLEYDEALAAVEQTLALVLANPRTHVLLTTSPIPFAQTFTGDDVIVANMYSKSMLRTVAGSVARRLDRVDYFPSYESVMLTKREEVWRADLVHVEEAFIGRVMARVTAAYVEDDAATDAEAGAATEEYDAAMTFSTLVRGSKFADAAALYPALCDRRGPDIGSLTLDLIDYELASGETARATERARSAADAQLVSQERADNLRFAALLMRCGLDDAAATQRGHAFALLGSNWVMVHNTIARLIEQGWTDERRHLVYHAEAAFADNAAALVFLAGQRRGFGDEADYHRLMTAALDLGAETHVHTRYAQEFLQAGDHAAARAVIARLADPADTTEATLQLASIARAGRDHDTAERLLRARLARAPDDARVLGNLALTLAQQGQHAKARAVAVQATALGNANPMVARIAERAG